MKRIILILSSLLIAFSANAQFASSGSQSSFGKATDGKRFVSYVKASASFNSFAYDKTILDLAKQEGANFSMGSNIGYNAVYGFQYLVTDNLGLYLGMEFGVGTRGMIMSETEPHLYKESVLTHNAKATPLQIGYKFNITELLALDAHIGGVVSYDFAGKSTMSSYYNEQSADIKDATDFRRFDVGINPGITLWIGPVGVDFTYQRGFLSISKNEEAGTFSKAFTNNFLLGLAYRF